MAMSAQAVAQSANDTAKPSKPEGSLYLQCDGNPDNMSAGEAIVRLVAITAIVGLFAPQPEEPDPAKRLFGEAGVASCTALIEGPKKEGGFERRIPLILARALHRIEAKDYSGALTDVELARQDARTAGLMENPYFQRSVGISFDRIEAIARIRLDDLAGARQATFGNVDTKAYSFFPLVSTMTFPQFGLPDDRELQLLSHRAKFDISDLWQKAGRLDELGRFEESAVIVNGILDDNKRLKSTDPNADRDVGPSMYAWLALANAFAEKWDEAQTYAAAGRERMKALENAGKPADNKAGIVELFDFYDILKLMHDGDVAGARRSFGARSEWTSPSFGELLEVHKRLSVDIAPQERMGLLTRTVEELRQERRDNMLAVMLESDKNNKSLFSNILPYANPADFEGLSKQVWNTKNTRIIDKKPLKDSNLYAVTIPDGNPMAGLDGMILHAALQAKARGKQGFIFYRLPSTLRLAMVEFVDPTDPGVFDQRYSHADDVIASLRRFIPSPDELAARKKKRNR
jgi:hypothetical protein